MSPAVGLLLGTPLWTVVKVAVHSQMGLGQGAKGVQREMLQALKDGEGNGDAQYILHIRCQT